MRVVKSDAYDDIERFNCFVLINSLILPYLNGMIEEDAVHGLPHHVHSSKGEGEIGESSTHTSPGQCLLQVSISWER